MANATTGFEADTTTTSADATTTSADTTTTSQAGTAGTSQNPLSLDIPVSDLLPGDIGLQVAADTGGTLTGSGDQDVLVGGSGDDTLNGGDGNDVLVGGNGSNILVGGGGDDRFGHVAGGRDIITDFAPEQDETLTLAQGLTVTSSEQGTITANLGDGTASHDAQILTLSDGSSVALVGFDQAVSSEWLITS